MDANALGLRASLVPTIVAPGRERRGAGVVHRDREEELIAVAQPRRGRRPVARTASAVVFTRPLPYLYLAREVFGGAGIPYQASTRCRSRPNRPPPRSISIIEFVSSRFTRASAVALLRSPHF